MHDLFEAFQLAYALHFFFVIISTLNSDPICKSKKELLEVYHSVLVPIHLLCKIKTMAFRNCSMKSWTLEHKIMTRNLLLTSYQVSLKNSMKKRELTESFHGDSTRRSFSRSSFIYCINHLTFAHITILVFVQKHKRIE